MSSFKAHFFLRFVFILMLFAPATRAQSNLKSEGDLKKQAEKFFASRDYQGATPLYSELLSLNQKNPDYNFKYGVCAMYTDKDKSKSLKFLELACKTPGVNEEAYFYLGKSFHLNYRFDEAIAILEKYKKEARQADVVRNDVDHLIEMCNNGKKVFTESVALDIVEQKEFPVSALFSGYELNALGGKVLIAPKEFRSKIDQKKSESSTIYLSKENFTVYYSSYGERDDNGKDLYKVIQLPNTEWSQPVNLGAVINTKYTEDYPFICSDGKTLYFSSEGHNSMGGLDIFKSEYDETAKTWSAPENLGYPINSTGDDIFYATGPAEPEFAWFSSNRETAVGRLIVYKIRIKKSLSSFLTIKGKFFSLDKPDLKTVKISIFNTGSNELLGTYMSNPSSADYLIKVAPGNSYNFVVEAEGYLPHSENINIPSLASGIASMNQEIKLKKDTTGEEMKVKNYFDPGLGALAENMKPQEVSSKFSYDADYKDKLKPVEIDGQIIFVTPPTTGPELGTLSVASSRDTSIKKSDFKGNISNNDLVKIAYDDAKEAEAEALSFKNDAEIASGIAFQRDSLAKVKGNEAQLAMASAQKLSNPAEKQEALKRASLLEDESNKMAKEAEVAYQMKSQLNAQALEKKQESDSALANARALDASVSNNKGDHALLQAKINKKKHNRSKGHPGHVAISDSATAGLSHKKEQAESELLYSERLNKEALALRDQAAVLKEKMKTSTSETERSTYNKEAIELEKTAADKQKNADQFHATGQHLKDSVKTSEIAFNISKKAEARKDSAVKDLPSPLVSIQTEKKEDLPLVTIQGNQPPAKDSIKPLPNESKSTSGDSLKIRTEVPAVVAAPTVVMNVNDPEYKKSKELEMLSSDNKTKAEIITKEASLLGDEAKADAAAASTLQENMPSVRKKKDKKIKADQIEVLKKHSREKQAGADSLMGIANGYLAVSQKNEKESQALKLDLAAKTELSEADTTVKLSDNTAAEARRDADAALVLQNETKKIKNKKIRDQKLAESDALFLASRNKQATADSLISKANVLRLAARSKKQSAAFLMPSLNTNDSLLLASTKKEGPDTSQKQQNPQAAKDSSTNQPLVIVRAEVAPATVADTVAHRPSAPAKVDSVNTKLATAPVKDLAEQDTAKADLKLEASQFKQQAEENYTEALKLDQEAKNDSLNAAGFLAAANLPGVDPAKKMEAKGKARSSEMAYLEKKQKAARLYEASKALANKSNNTGEATGVNPEPVKTVETAKVSVQVSNPEAKKEEQAAAPAKNAGIFVASAQSVYNESNPIPLNPALPEGLIFKVQIGAFRNPIPQNTFKGIQPITGEKTGNGLTRYTAGLFIAFESSNLVKKEIRSLGYKDAFVVAFFNGKRIPLFEAADIVDNYSIQQKRARKDVVKEELKALKKNNIYAEKYNNQPDADLAAYNKTGNNNANIGDKATDASPDNVSSLSLKYDGLIYTVQVGVFRSPDLPRKFKGMPRINRDQLPNGLYRFSTGVFNYYGAADSARTLAAAVAPDAFVIALYKGQKITAVEGKRLERLNPPVKIADDPDAITNKGTVVAGDIKFRVQLGAFKSQVPVEIINKYLQLKGGKLNNLKRNELTVFYIGNVSELEAAEALKKEAVSAGLSDAFIVAFEDDKQIGVEEAIGKLKK